MLDPDFDPLKRLQDLENSNLELYQWLEQVSKQLRNQGSLLERISESLTHIGWALQHLHLEVERLKQGDPDETHIAVPKKTRH